ncbi:MAG TPA: FkbM family methyltransferase [Crinalium sp.]|jgi:FkbM family methyltransferase
MNRLIDWLKPLPRPWLKATAKLQWQNPLFKRLYDRITDQFRNQNLVIQRGLGEGLRFNAGNANAGYILGTSEPGMQVAMQELLWPQMTFYDIGAGVGFFSIIAAALAEGTVVCFEPLAMNVKRIQHNARLNRLKNLIIKAEAIGKEDGETEFNVAGQLSLSKLAKLGSPAQLRETISVPIRRLDTAIASDQLPPPGLIKIDVEGAELDVLQGAIETLKTHRPMLLIELHNTAKGVNALLTELNYESCIIGSQAPAYRASKNARIFAYPKERTDLEESATRLALYVP